MLLVLGGWCLGPLAMAASDPAKEASTPSYRFSDPRRWAPVFEDPSRDRWQKPDRVVAALDLRGDEVLADIGAGTGYFARRLARPVAAGGGRVYAVEIEPELLAYLSWRARQEGVANIETVLATAEDSALPDACCDLIFFCNTYYLLADRVQYLRRLLPKLRPGGRVVIIDWRRQASPQGPAPRWRLSPRQVMGELGEAGLELIAQHEFLPYQYFLVAAAADAPRPGGP